MNIILSGKDIKRFWDKVEKNDKDKCWEWLASKDKDGYGYFSVKGKTYKAHRISYIINSGNQIPIGMVIMHSCDTTSCINPEHLSLGTVAKNNRDIILKNRQNWNPAIGTNNGKSILNEYIVLEMRNFYKNGKTFKEISEHFDVKIPTVRAVIYHHSWRHVGGYKGVASQTHKLNMNIAKKIRHQYQNKISTIKELAKKYKVNVSNIYAILSNRIYKEKL